MLHVPEQLALCQQRTVSLCWAIEHYGNVWHFFLDSVRKSKFLIYLDLLYFDLPFFLCFVACSGFSFLSMAPSILDCEHGSFGWVTGGAMKVCIRLMPVHSRLIARSIMYFFNWFIYFHYHCSSIYCWLIYLCSCLFVYLLLFLCLFLFSFVHLFVYLCICLFFLLHYLLNYVLFVEYVYLFIFVWFIHSFVHLCLLYLFICSFIFYLFLFVYSSTFFMFTLISMNMNTFIYIFIFV